MISPIEIVHRFIYEGPNIYGPQSGVFVQVRCDTDRSKRLKHTLKDAAQTIGLVIAYLEVETRAAHEGYLINARFTTPLPHIGGALVGYVVDGMGAEARADVRDDAEAWDDDTPLMSLQQQRREQDLSAPLLQLIAEARARKIPVLRPTPADRFVRFGYGAHGQAVDPADDARQSLRAIDEDEDMPRPTSPPVLPWEQLGAVPIYAITGERYRSSMVQQVAAQLHAQGYAISVTDGATSQETRALLAQPDTRCLVVGLDTAAILRHGVAFDRCTQAIITDMQGVQPVEALTAQDWSRALGLPMLLSHTPALLNMSDPAVAHLAAYAPDGIHPLNAPDGPLPL